MTAQDLSPEASGSKATRFKATRFKATSSSTTGISLMTEQDVGVAFATLATALAVALHKQGVADGEALLAETVGTLEAVLQDDYPEQARAILSACARSLRAAEG